MADPVPKAIKARVAKICQRIGRRAPLWCQGPGANVSWKGMQDGRSLIVIKASGMRLDEVETDKGLVTVDIERFRRLAGISGLLTSKTVSDDQDEAAYAEVLRGAAVPDPSGQRPSMETGFHAALPATFVVHVHSLAALLMAAAESHKPGSVKGWLAGRLGGPVEFLPPTLPGLGLAWAARDRKTAKALILENHGVILQMESEAELDTWTSAEIDFCEVHGYTALAARLRAPESPVTPGEEPLPLRFFFPDTAVFFARLEPCLVAAPRRSPHEEIRYHLRTVDRDLVELWEAQRILLACDPFLSELPQDLVLRIPGLPTERVRALRHAS